MQSEQKELSNDINSSEYIFEIQLINNAYRGKA